MLHNLTRHTQADDNGYKREGKGSEILEKLTRAARRISCVKEENPEKKLESEGMRRMKAREEPSAGRDAG